MAIETSVPRRRLELFGLLDPLTLAKAYAWTATVLVDEFDTGGLKVPAEQLKLFAVVIVVRHSASSARRIVRRLTDDCRERSSALHLKSAPSRPDLLARQRLLWFLTYAVPYGTISATSTS